MTAREATSGKLRSVEALVEIGRGYKRQGKTVVWTNGFFEILHAGHIEFLLKAARLADVFMVGVNSDESVRQLKGAGHPVSPEHERVQVLSAVSCVNYVTVFPDLTCTRILRSLEPEVYAKGLRHLHGGIDPDERQAIEDMGHTIALIGGDPAKSTASIIARIRQT